MSKLSVLALSMAALAATVGAAEGDEAPWVCVPTEDRGWQCGRDDTAPAQTPLPPPEPPAAPPPGYTAPGDATPLPAYLQVTPGQRQGTTADPGPADQPHRPDEATADSGTPPQPEDRAPEPPAPAESAADIADTAQAPTAGATPPRPGAPATGPVYGIQLVSVRDPESLAGFAAEHGLDAGTVYRRQWRDQGGVWHVLLTGRYSSVSAARRALESLPGPLRRAGAWVRRVDTLSTPDQES